MSYTCTRCMKDSMECQCHRNTTYRPEAAVKCFGGYGVNGCDTGHGIEYKPVKWCTMISIDGTDCVYRNVINGACTYEPNICRYQMTQEALDSIENARRTQVRLDEYDEPIGVIDRTVIMKSGRVYVKTKYGWEKSCNYIPGTKAYEEKNK